MGLSAGTVITKKTRIQTIEFPWGLYCLVVLFVLLYVFYVGTYRRNRRNVAFSLTWPASMQIYWKKGSVYIRKEFKSHRIGLEHQHGRRLIVLEHQYDRRDVM